MQKTTNLKLILGLGKTGLSCVRHLIRQGANVAVMDSRDNPPGLLELQQQFPNVPIFLGKFDTNILNQASELIVSPGLSLKEPAIAAQIKRGVSVIGDIELFARAAKAKVVAITGSNGKSTVTTLVGEMAKDAGLDTRVGGNLGTPALELITKKEPDLYVLELSSFQLETTFSLAPEVAVILNVTADHMDRYADFAEYLTAKQLIYRHAKNCVLNRDDLQSYAEVSYKNNTTSFGLDAAPHNAFGLQEGFLMYEDQQLITSSELKIKGRHQVANALAALAIGKVLNLPMTKMLATLRAFTGLQHRCQWVRTINGVAFYNDSKATNVGATEATIAGLGAEIKGKVILIAGGMGKDADFSSLHEVVKQYVREAVLIGRDAPIIARCIEGATEIVNATSMEDAVHKAFLAAKPYDAVLLAPACASFDMFNNFEHRGDEFARCVKALN